MGRAQPKAIAPSRTSLLRAVRELRAADVRDRETMSDLTKRAPRPS